ncbi:MAG: response regulator [Gemmatimonadota bacterium]
MSYQQAFVLEDATDFAAALKKELESFDVTATIFDNADDLVEAATALEEGMLLLDLDMGVGRNREGIEAVGSLRELQEAHAKDFYIAAYTSHADYQKDALEAGVDAFLVKDSPRVDALELITLASAHSIDLHRRAAEHLHKELARRAYPELIRDLRLLKGEQKLPQYRRAVSAARRALARPFLSEDETIVLSAVSQILESAGSASELPDDVLNKITEGIDLLRHLPEAHGNVSEWARDLLIGGQWPIFSWADDDLEF